MPFKNCNLFFKHEQRSRKVIKAIIFDLDQTLLDRIGSLKRFLNWQINFFQLVPNAQKQQFIQRFIELDANGSVWKDVVYQQLIIEFKITQFSVAFLLDLYLHDFNRFCLAFEGVEHSIQQLYQDGYQLALVSNGKTPFQEHNFKALGLNEYFSTIIVSEAVGIRKPETAIFNLASQRLGVQPEQCIFIGDHEQADILGAKRAKMKTIFFNEDININSNHADENLHHFSDLITILKKMK